MKVDLGMVVEVKVTGVRGGVVARKEGATHDV